MKHPHTPFALVVLDGWGSREGKEHNPIAEAKTPFYDELLTTYPHALLDASGVEVGLPEGQMGNSEIGHMVIGSGMVIPTDLVRIQAALDRGEGDTNQVLQDLFAHVKERNSVLHLVGLVGTGGVHAQQSHLVGILRAAKRAGVTKAFIHSFTDGRDTPPQSAAGFVKELERELKEIGIGRIATLCGRFYAMDRDKNWERIGKAESALFERVGTASAATPEETLLSQYEAKQQDEQLEPFIFSDENGEVCAPIQKGDGVFFFNFRADRAAQLSRRILERVKDLDVLFATMTIYDETLACPVAFPSFVPPVTLAAELSSHGLTQTHIAETEKYAHATYFLNGGRATPHQGEDFVLIESQKVRTHDLAPEMRAKEITDAALVQLEAGKDFLFLNYANADMVGHTANHAAIIQAVEVIDHELSRLVTAVTARGGVVLITADHGNAEQSFDPHSNQSHTAHTLNVVPAIFTKEGVQLRPRGTLADITPTILDWLELPIPADMTGKSLLVS